eukprot:487091-Pyramimonas_sp.AAC.1
MEIHRFLIKFPFGGHLRDHPRSLRNDALHLPLAHPMYSRISQAKRSCSEVRGSDQRLQRPHCPRMSRATRSLLA